MAGYCVVVVCEQRSEKCEIKIPAVLCRQLLLKAPEDCIYMHTRFGIIVCAVETLKNVTLSFLETKSQ